MLGMGINNLKMVSIFFSFIASVKPRSEPVKLIDDFGFNFFQIKFVSNHLSFIPILVRIFIRSSFPSFQMCFINGRSPLNMDTVDNHNGATICWPCNFDCTKNDVNRDNHEDNDEDLLEDLKMINENWNKYYNIENGKTTNTKCKVKFIQEPPPITIFEAEDLSDIPDWYIVAVDRKRFSDRVKNLEKILSPVLESKHRKKMRKYIRSFR